MPISKSQLFSSLLLFAGSLQTAFGALGIDVSTSTSEDSWSCMIGYGYSYAIVRGYLSYGAVDTNVITTLENARAAGVQYRDIYVFPCRGLDATDQMDEFADYLEANSYYSGSDYQYAWLDLESNPKTECYWSSYSGSSNCDYVAELIKALEDRGIAVGIYSSYYNWELIFDSVNNCQDFTSYPLWYAHYDDDASFASWDDIPFGGWDTPSMKQYVGDDEICSTGVDFNYAPVSFFDNYYSSTNADCDDPQTDGDVSVSFPSNSITSISSCSTNYEDPNDMGTYLFSASGSGTSTYLSNNFQISEFTSPDGADYFRLSPYLVECLQSVRTDIAEALYIKEAYRTQSYNSEVNGASASRHLSGAAADIYASSSDVLEVTESVICNCFETIEGYGLSMGFGYSEDYVHIDLRESYGYWVETGSDYSSSDWNEYISTKYKSCTGSTLVGGTEGNGGGDDSDDNTNSDGTIKFPNVNLTPIYSSSSDYDDPNDSGTSLFSGSDAGTSTKLSDNFAVSEFMCNDGSDGFRLAPELVECLQAVRDELGISININSGYRTVSYNSQVGGAQYSRHQSGTAADIQQYSTDIWTFADSVICNCRNIFIAAGQEIGLGLGYSYLHVDMRPYYSYWVYSGASLSQSSWNSYISNQYSSCSSYATASGYVIGSDTVEAAANGESDYDYNENSRDDIDDEEEVYSDDSNGNKKNNNNFFEQWYGILTIVLLSSILIGVIGYFACKECKYYIQQKNTNNQFSSGYTKVEES